MKKIIFLFAMVSLLCFSKNSFAQLGATGNLYEDAQKYLKAAQTGINKNEFLSVASFYSGTNITSHSDFKLTLEKGPKLNPFLNKIKLNFTEAVDPVSASPQGFSGSVMGLNVTNFADGLAKFLIQRAKQELSMAFFNRFKEDLKHYPEVKKLFPHSVYLLSNIELYNINTLLQELRDAFMKDLLNIPRNILSLRDVTFRECNNDSVCYKRTREIKSIFSPTANPDPRIFVIPLTVLQGVMDGNNIIKIMNSVSSESLICNANNDFNSYIKLIAMFMDALRTNNDKEGLFLNETQLRNLFSNEDLLNTFVGLLYQKHINNPCFGNLTLGGQNLEAIFNSVISKRYEFYAGLAALENINQACSGIKKQIQNGQKIDVATYASLTSSSLGSIGHFTKGFSGITGAAIPNEFNLLIDNLKSAADMSVDIYQRNYPGIFNASIILIKQNNIFKNETFEKVSKYLVFAANIASASNSDEMNEAINAVALPPGSYSVKQNSYFNIALNGYIGYGVDMDFATAKNPFYSYGAYAPLGVSFSWGIGKNKKGGAFTIFASLIEVGSLVSFRLANNTTDTLKQEVKLESIFSPSTQLMYAFPKMPLALCIGWRSTPKLFYSQGSNFTTLPTHDVLNISLLIDIPVVNVKNSPRK